MDTKQRFKTIDEYIGAFPDDVQNILEEIRQIIREAAPGAVEAIAYQMPTFKLDGRNLLHFAAWKNHIAVYPVPSGTPVFREELAPYIASKGTARFPLDKPVPYSLLKKMAGFRVKETSKKDKENY